MLGLFIFCTIVWFTTSYDSNSLQFDPTGRLLQVEYSKQAALKGSPVMGFQCLNGILLINALKLPNSRLQVSGPSKLFRIDPHIYLACAGMLFDSQVIVDVSRKLCE